MTVSNIILKPIGIIHTPYRTPADMPIQPVAAEGVKGHIQLFPEYAEGLTHLEGFSHLTLIYHLHGVKGYELMTRPFMDNQDHGVFATRSPKRPNAIGLSTVKLLNIEDTILQIEMVDMLDGTPLIDIKPFFEKFDNRFETKAGWLDKKDLSGNTLRSDDRFTD